MNSMISTSVQSAVLSGTANILAQIITAYRNDIVVEIDWVPVFQFFIFTLISTPPNLIWQGYLEDTFPAHSVQKPSASDKPTLNIRNTITKMLLDQTVGAAVNTILYSMFMHSLRAAMTVDDAANGFGFGAGRVDYARVDWMSVVARTRAEFVPLVLAGWRFWPAVSFVNFALVKSVQARALVGGLAGLVWGVYISLFAASA